MDARYLLESAVPGHLHTGLLHLEHAACTEF